MRNAGRLRSQCAYRNAVAISMCLSKRGQCKCGDGLGFMGPVNKPLKVEAKMATERPLETAATRYSGQDARHRNSLEKRRCLLPSPTNQPLINNDKGGIRAYRFTSKTLRNTSKSGRTGNLTDCSNGRPPFRKVTVTLKLKPNSANMLAHVSERLVSLPASPFHLEVYGRINRTARFRGGPA